METDYLLLGCGIAGASLAIRLLDAGFRVVVYHDPETSRATEIAAGLFNPIVFKRITFSWRAHACLRDCHTFYPMLEERFGKRFFYPENLIRIHGSEEERIQWERMSEQDLFEDFLKEALNPEERPWIKQTYGASLLKGAGFVDTPTFLGAVESYLEDLGCLRREQVQFEEIIYGDQGVHYRDVQAKKVIFCTGVHASTQGPFSYLPFNPAKGEVLTMQIDGLPEEIINGKIYGVPLGGGRFRFGGTYAWNENDEEPTAAGRNELEEKTAQLISLPYSVMDHKAGLRPTVKDRRPLIGMHPMLPSAGVFNGMGTKGILLAPNLSAEFAEHLIQGTPLSKDVSIERYQSLLVP
jgi:glycine/D-amino acid oxidase-like deaminating enzyme